MQQAVAEPGFRLQRVPEGVTQVQERALAAFAFVGGDDPRLCRAGNPDGLDAGFLLALQHGHAVGLQPVEEIRVVDQAILHHLRIASEKLAAGQGGKNPRIGQHQTRLIKGADQVLAVTAVDPGLAADRTVDLRQQGCRHLDEVHAPQQAGGGKACEVADNAAAEGDQPGRTVGLALQQVVQQALEL